MRSIIFYWNLWRLKRERESLRRKIDKEYKNAKTSEEREEIWGTSHWDVDIAQQAVQWLQTRYYSDQADRKGIPKPQTPEDWEEVISSPGTRVLTVTAIARLRSAIRQDQKEFRDVWLPQAAFIISIIAIIIAILNYRKPAQSQQSTIQQQNQILHPTPSPKVTIQQPH